jgi:hypothetical protein
MKDDEDEDEDDANLGSLHRSNSGRKRDPPAKKASARWKPLYPGEDESGLVIRSPPSVHSYHFEEFKQTGDVAENPTSPLIDSRTTTGRVGIEAPPETEYQPAETAQSSTEEKNPFIEWRRRNNPRSIKSTISKDNTSAARTEVQEGLLFLGQKFGRKQVYLLFQIPNLSAR